MVYHKLEAKLDQVLPVQQLNPNFQKSAYIFLEVHSASEKRFCVY